MRLGSWTSQLLLGTRRRFLPYLAEKYGVEIVINDEYATRNNNGTLWAVRNRLANTYICSSDNYFTSNPFETYVYQSYYSAQFVEGTTDEWCIETAQNGLITESRSVARILDHARTRLLRQGVLQAFPRDSRNGLHPPGDRASLWEEIFIDHLDVLPDGCSPVPGGGWINEFDSLDELQGFDPLFIENVDSEVFDNIVEVLNTTIRRLATSIR